MSASSFTVVVILVAKISLFRFFESICAGTVQM